MTSIAEVLFLEGRFGTRLYPYSILTFSYCFLTVSRSATGEATCIHLLYLISNFYKVPKYCVQNCRIVPTTLSSGILTDHKFQANVPYLYPLKTSGNHRFSDVPKGYRNGTLAWNGLKTITVTSSSGYSSCRWGYFSFVKKCRNSDRMNFTKSLLDFLLANIDWNFLVIHASKIEKKSAEPSVYQKSY